MCRTVTDAAILLTALAGADPDDAATKALSRRTQTAVDYTKSLGQGIEGLRIGVPRKKLYGQSAPADRLVEAVLAELKKLGAIIVDPADVDTVGALTERVRGLLFEGPRPT
jgi:amidase